MNKLLSIVVPSYNMEAYLPTCLGSLIVDDAELLRTLEVIVVNDGSTDRTSETAHGFENRYPGVFRVIDKSNGHYGSCINAGLRVATGKYVKVLDADDSFDTDCFSRYVAFLSECDADMVFNNYIAVHPDKTVRYEIRYPFLPRVMLPISELKLLEGAYYMHGIAFRKKMLDNICYRQMEGVLYTDGEWCAIPPLVAKTLAYCPESVYRYLVGREGQSVGNRIRDKNYEVLIDILKDIDDKCGQFRHALALENLEIYHLWVKSYLKMVYDICMDAVSPVHFKRAFGRLDELVKERFPSAYLMQDMSIHLGRHTFHYLDFMRRHRCLSVVTISFVRVVWRMRIWTGRS